MTHHNEQEAIGGFEADTIMGDASQGVSSATIAPDAAKTGGSVSPTQLNEDVKLFLAGVNPQICPTVYSIIAQQAAIIEQQRAVMEMAREAIDNSIAFIGYASHVPEKVEACEAALTALDAALGRV